MSSRPSHVVAGGGIPFLLRLSDSPLSARTTFRAATVCRWTRGLLPPVCRCDACCRERGVHTSVECTFAARLRTALGALGHAVHVTPRCPSPARGPAVGRNSLPVCTGTAAPRGFTHPVLTRSFSQGSSPFEFCLLWFFLLDGLASHSFAGFLYVLRTPLRAHLSLCLLSIEVLKPELVTCHRCPLDHVSFENLGRKDPTLEFSCSVVSSCA